MLYSETNPRVKVIKAKIVQLEQAVETERQKTKDSGTPEETSNPALNLRLAEIDTRVETLEAQKTNTEVKITDLTDTIDRTPATTAHLEDLQREYENIQQQYNSAVQRLADASTGERIEVLSRGERISIIEQPAIPSEPTKPNRILIAGGGIFLGIVLGLALVVSLEVLNRAPRRPEDIIGKLGVWPMAAIPYTRSRRELFIQRGRKLLIIMVILVGVPVAVWSIHEYYLPLDLLADKAMNKLGVRW